MSDGRMLYRVSQSQWRARVVPGVAVSELVPLDRALFGRCA